MIDAYKRSIVDQLMVSCSHIWKSNLGDMWDSLPIAIVPLSTGNKISKMTFVEDPTSKVSDVWAG